MPSGRLLINADAVSRLFGDEVVVVHLQTNRIYSLNRTGAKLWALLADGHNRDTLIARLAEEFDVPPDVLARDVDAILTSLREERLIQESDAG